MAELRNSAFVDDIKSSMVSSQVAAPKPGIHAAGGSWRVVQIRCGEQHSMILVAGGSVWVWGSNANGQLGLGEDQEEVRYVGSSRNDK